MAYVTDPSPVRASSLRTVLLSGDCGHTSVRRIADADSSRVFLYCWGCTRVVGTYDPHQAGSFEGVA